MMTRGFPITLDNEIKVIPWATIAPHEAQAKINHGQTLEALAARGGITPEEAIAIIEDRPFERMAQTPARLRLKQLVESTGTYAKVIHDLERADAALGLLVPGSRMPDLERMKEVRLTIQDAALVLRALMPR